MDEQLVELVRCHEELYNSAHKRYSDNIHKQKLWREFADQLQKSPEFCKKRWESLRAQFRKVCRSRKTGQVAENKKWKYEAELSFLLPYMKDKPRLTSTNLWDLSVNSDESGDHEPVVDEEMTNVFFSQNATAIPTSSLSVSDTSTMGSNIQQSTRKRARQLGRHTPRVVPETAESALVKYIIDQKKSEHVPQQKDALDYFFDGIKETVKTFSARDRHFVKTKIFNIVSEIECKYLDVENNSQTI